MGDPGVGKTALLVRYVDDRFITDYRATLGFDISMKKLFHSGTEFSIAIWDIAGQEKLEKLLGSYLEGSQGAILIYDVTNSESFKNINIWLNNLRKFGGEVPFILVGNKIDLIDEIQIRGEEGGELMKKIKASTFYETSAKTGEKVNKIFQDIAIKIYEQSHI